MKIVVAGATGVIGRRLVPLLVSAGHDVVGLSRHADRAAQLDHIGARGVVCDVLDAPRVRKVLLDERPDSVIHELTDLPASIDARKIESQLAANDRLRVEGTRNLVRAAHAAGVRRVVAQSYAQTYAPRDGWIKTETDPLYTDAPQPWRRTVLAIQALEDEVLHTPGLDGVALRYGQLYGHGTAYGVDGAYAELVRHGQFPIPGKGRGTFSFIHVDDAAAAAVLALNAVPGVYNIVDDEPATLAEWLPLYAQTLGAPPPKHVPLLLARLLGGRYLVFLGDEQRGVSNAKARLELHFKPHFASWREGFVAEAGAGAAREMAIVS